jgi:hypothetical protein
MYTLMERESCPQVSEDSANIVGASHDIVFLGAQTETEAVNPLNSKTS